MIAKPKRTLFGILAMAAVAVVLYLLIGFIALKNAGFDGLVGLVDHMLKALGG